MGVVVIFTVVNFMAIIRNRAENSLLICKWWKKEGGGYKF
jgi:hypothetical protein